MRANSGLKMRDTHKAFLQSKDMTAWRLSAEALETLQLFPGPASSCHYGNTPPRRATQALEATHILKLTQIILDWILHKKRILIEMSFLRTYLGHGLNLNMNCGLDGCFSNFSRLQTHLVGFSKHRWTDPTPRISDSAWLGCRLRMCFSNKFPGDADAAGLRSHF